MSPFKNTSKRKKQMLGLAAMGVFLFYHFLHKPGSATKETADLSSSSVEERTKAQKELLLQEFPEGFSAEEGDTTALQRLYRTHFGLRLKEIRRNADGTFDAVISGEETALTQSAPVLSPQEERNYRSQILQLENKGQEVQISERDRKEIEAFRRGTLGL